MSYDEPVHLRFSFLTSKISSLCGGNSELTKIRDTLMDPSQWTHILTLLAITVIIDGKIYKEEVDTFVAESVKLKESLSPDMIFSEKMVFDWFVVHRDEIAKWLKEPESHTQVLRHILALGENPDREGILSAMYAIAIADTKYHKTESDTLSLAAKHWNLPHPHQEETD